MKNLKSLRWQILLAVALAAAALLASVPLHVFADAPASKIKIDASAAAPRQVEDSTVQSVQRDYAAAWAALAKALDNNNAGVLNANFVGAAREQAGNLIQQQSANGLHQRYIDHGHNVKITMYSIDGSAMQLHDTVQLEIQQMDGGKVVHSETATVHYLALMTPAQNSWQVRVLEAVP